MRQDGPLWDTEGQDGPLWDIKRREEPCVEHKKVRTDLRWTEIGETGLCGPWVHVDHGSLWTKGLYGPWVYMNHRSTWTMGLYGPWVYMDHRSTWTMGLYGPWVYWTIGLHGPWVYMDHGSIWIMDIFFYLHKSHTHKTTIHVPRFTLIIITLVRNESVHVMTSPRQYRSFETNYH